MAEKNKKVIEKIIDTVKEENRNDTDKTITEAKPEEKQADSKSSNDGIKKTVEIKKESNDVLAIIIMIIILAVATLVYFKKDVILNIFKTRVVKNTNKQEEIYENLKADREFYNKEFQKLTTNIKVLEREIELNDEYIKSLRSKVSQIEAQLNDVNIAPQKTELIKVAINIQSKISNELSYSEELSLLKSLAKGNATLLDKINVLELYKNKYPTEKITMQNFKEEFEIFSKEHNILKNNDNKVSKFLANFIVIRKIDNVENTTSDSFMVKLENAIKTKNYELSLEILESNPEYISFFPKTMEDVKTKVLLNNTIEEIINYLINN